MLHRQRFGHSRYCLPMPLPEWSFHPGYHTSSSFLLPGHCLPRLLQHGISLLHSLPAYLATATDTLPDIVLRQLLHRLADFQNGKCHSMQLLQEVQLLAFPRFLHHPVWCRLLVFRLLSIQSCHPVSRFLLLHRNSCGSASRIRCPHLVRLHPGYRCNFRPPRCSFQ